MTSRQLLGLCIVISAIAHFWLIQLEWSTEPTTGGEQIVIPMDFDVTVSTPGEALALEQGIEESSEKENCEEAARRLKRLAVKRYLEKIHAAVEHRKFLPGNGNLSGLIGNVRYSFHIQPDDTFSDIRLVRSSGDPRLDRAAGRAIAAASGVTKRPKIIQGQSFTIGMTVKYQYNM